ncbi:MAG TPA: site-2 protease family protein [Gemmatimonadales bacterium]|nr:site-2 protease family protein [Gemmatimonadales bacterium]
MGWSFRIGRLWGTELKVHVTFLLLLAYVAYLGYSAGGGPTAVTSVVFILGVFACVVLHEFGHARMAARFGIRTPDIILLPIGGVARLERVPEDPRQELLIAVAGPAVTFVLAALAWVGLRLTHAPVPETDAPVTATTFLAMVFQVNLYLLLFNLIPAFPMDGGRVLRALLARRLGFPRATVIAARIGRFIAVIFALVGLFGLPPANQPNGILVLIALFVWLGATSEANAVAFRSVGAELTAEQVMVRRFDTLPAWAPLERAVELLLSTDQREFPVLDAGGRLAGLLTRDHLVLGLHRFGPSAEVKQVMSPHVPVLAPAVPFPAALEALLASRLPALPVVDANGTVVGLFSKDNVADLLLVRRSRPH